MNIIDALQKLRDEIKEPRPERPMTILISAREAKAMQALPGGICLENYAKVHGLKDA